MKYAVLTLSVLFCFASILTADEVTYDASQDTEVDEVLSTINFGAEPDIEIYADWEDDPVWLVKALFLFPVDLPAGAIVDEAVLQVHVLDRSTDPGPVNIFRVADSWAEMSVTWDSRPGENRDIVVSENAPEVIINPEPWDIDVTDIVQSWADGFPNNGFYLDVPDNDNWVDVDLATKENSDSEIRPHLWVNYHVGGACEEDEGDRYTLNVSTISSRSISINYSLSDHNPARIRIYDAAGALVASYYPQSGNHSINFDTAPGVYFVKFNSGSEEIVKKAVCVR